MKYNMLITLNPLRNAVYITVKVWVEHNMLITLNPLRYAVYRYLIDNTCDFYITGTMESIDHPKLDTTSVISAYTSLNLYW